MVDQAYLRRAIVESLAPYPTLAALCDAVGPIRTDAACASQDVSFAEVVASDKGYWRSAILDQLCWPSTPGSNGHGEWAMADGSPVVGREREAFQRLGLGCAALALLGEDAGLDDRFRRQLTRVCYFMVVRHIGTRHQEGSMWGLWLSVLALLGPELVNGLPLSVQPHDSVEFAVPALRVDDRPNSAWRGLAFRESGVVVAAGCGLVAVGSPTGCEFYDGHERVAAVRGDDGEVWELEGARSSAKAAGFRLLSPSGSRLILRGRQGRLALISESTRTDHRLRVQIAPSLTDSGPRKFSGLRASLSLDRLAAWRCSDGWWLGELRCDDVPNRLRVSCAPV